MRRIFEVLAHISLTELSVLILGETGTGKELAARAIHDASPRRGGPFVVVDCTSIPHPLAESILFGHERGAFTGAGERRLGALAHAHGGTVFLDELGELPLEIQPKLLRALAEREVRRLGGSEAQHVDVRLVSATRRDLAAEVDAGRFRSDLYFRVAQVRLQLPALRERSEDIPLLIDDLCARAGSPAAAASVRNCIAGRFSTHGWPGNVRELVNVVGVAAALAATPDLIDHVIGPAADKLAAPCSFLEAKRAFESEYWRDLALTARGNVSHMARTSGMKRHHVRAHLRKHGIERAALVT